MLLSISCQKNLSPALLQHMCTWQAMKSPSIWNIGPLGKKTMMWKSFYRAALLGPCSIWKERSYPRGRPPLTRPGLNMCTSQRDVRALGSQLPFCDPLIWNLVYQRCSILDHRKLTQSCLLNGKVSEINE